MRNTRLTAIAAIGIAAASVTACSPEAHNDKVVVVTHDSFSLPDDVIAAFEKESGLDVEFVALGDGGTLANQLILTKDAPLGDAVYGIDNTFGSRVVDEGVLEDYVPGAATAAVSQYALDGSTIHSLTPIDFSDVCINADLTYFDAQGIPVPQTLEDLADPQYQDLLAVTNPATSSPGLAFLFATASAFGDDWPQYWQRLEDNGLKISGSWSDVYFTDFSAPNYGGDRPLVLSYASSPPSELIDGEPTTVALLDTCFRQVEYAGVLAGAANPEGAQRVIDWMLSDEVQSALPDSMYVYPVSPTATIPDQWQQYAPLAQHPWPMDAKTIDSRRDDLVQQWTDEVLG